MAASVWSRTLCPATIHNALSYVVELAEAEAEKRAPLPYWHEDAPVLRVLVTWGYVEHIEGSPRIENGQWYRPPAMWRLTVKGKRRYNQLDKRVA